MSINQAGRVPIMRPNFARRSNRKRVLNISRISPYLVPGWEQKLERKPDIMNTDEILDLVKINLKYPIVSLHQIEHLKYFLGDHFAAYLRKVSKAMEAENKRIYRCKMKQHQRLIELTTNNNKSVQQESTKNI